MIKLAILGPGLLGGSIALAVRKRRPDTRIAIWARREAAVAEVREANLADTVSSDLEPIVKDADLIVFCMPIGAMAALAGKIAPMISPKALITDVGSVKATVVKALAPIFKNHGHFVGSHPMAGSEQAGLQAARADLFEGAVCIVTPEEDADHSTLEAVAGFWSELGCDVRFQSPDEHDEVIGLVSHLPHLLAATLVNLVCDQNHAALNFCGNGFRDTTRVASGPAGMWAEILLSNRAALSPQIHAMIEKLKEAASLLAENDERRMTQFLMEAKTQRDCLRK